MSASHVAGLLPRLIRTVALDPTDDQACAPRDIPVAAGRL